MESLGYAGKGSLVEWDKLQIAARTVIAHQAVGIWCMCPAAGLVEINVL